MSRPAPGSLPSRHAPLPEGDEKVAAVRAMFDTISPRYDLVNRVMTFGLDVGWRRRAVRALGLPNGSRVLDLACGTGDLIDDLGRAGYTPIGVDLSLGMLRHAPARRRGKLTQGDAIRLPVGSEACDGVISGFALRNFVALPPVWAELARVVRPGGRIALLDVSRPTNPLLRAGHELYFGRVVPLIGGLLSSADAYRYLPRSVAYLPGPDELSRQLERAGFTAVARRQLTGGITQLITATRGAPGASR